MYDDNKIKNAVYFGIEDEIQPAKELIYTAEMALRNIVDCIKPDEREQYYPFIKQIKAVQACIYTAYSKLDEFIDDPFCDE